MPQTQRASDLAERLDQLRGWGTLSLTRLWTHMDAEAVRTSFLDIHPALVAVHQAQVAEALEALDQYMFLTAADDGLLYDTRWRSDQPGRPFTTATGRNATEYISRTPFVILNRIKRGKPPARAMLIGFNYLGRLYGTEPHRVVRAVMWSRFQDDQLEQMAAG